MAGGNESDNLSAGEPAICEDVIKVYFSGDETLYHLYHELYLALVILLDTLCCMAVLVTFLLEPSVKLFLLQVVRPLLSFLTNKAEVHEHLSRSVRNAEEQPFEAENHLVLNMREHLSNHLCLDASLWIVRIVNHQTHGSISIPLCACLCLAPKLGCDIGEDLTPVIILSGKKTIEYVLTAVGNAA